MRAHRVRVAGFSAPPSVLVVLAAAGTVFAVLAVILDS